MKKFSYLIGLALLSNAGFAQDTFAELDRNQDGELSYTEIADNEIYALHFGEADADGNRSLNAEEFSQLVDLIRQKESVPE